MPTDDFFKQILADSLKTEVSQIEGDEAKLAHIKDFVAEGRACGVNDVGIAEVIMLAGDTVIQLLAQDGK
jgi:hypothetical protein